MNSFLAALNSSKEINIDDILKRAKLEMLQVNLGNLCNQSCFHCHIEASPQGKKIMPKKTIDDIILFLFKNRNLTLDITGGAPELNPHFDYFITAARPFAKEIIVRSNLTVFFEPQKDYLPQFFKKNNIHLICSLPCYQEKNVEKQRGAGVFQKSILALKELNKFGYAKNEELKLDIVYNPAGPYLPPQQEELDRQYRLNLGKDYGVEFNRLIAITNVPIKRFKNYLESNGEYEKYMDILKNSFNSAALESIMCRTFLSVGYDGKLYDCDFNQALGWALKDGQGAFLSIDGLNLADLDERDIMVGEHCFSCAAGYGSSCQGALLDRVKFYYGKILKSKEDLKTSACCSVADFPEPIKTIVKNIEPEVLDKFYGCGSPLPPLLQGCRVLDLGSGSGRDVYIASRLVGEHGFVTGIDMTDEQLNVARKYKEAQMKRFGFRRCNVDFKKGYIEDLKEVGIEDNSQDVVISNCVINLSPDKKRVFSEIFRVLKPGGELYFSDIFADRRIPQDLKNDPVFYGECLGGAMYFEDFRCLLNDLDCPDFRYMSKRKINIDDPKIAEKAGGITFCSVTVRAFKLEDLEDICEDYGQVAYYQGTIPNFPHQFRLDDHHVFITHKPMLVCGNTASMLTNTRFAKHFKIIGDTSTHFGPFDCAVGSGKIKSLDSGTGGSCC